MCVRATDIYEVMTSNGLDFVDACTSMGVIGTVDTLRVAKSHVVRHSEMPCLHVLVSLSECMGVSIQAWEFRQRTIRADGALVQGCRRPTSFALSDLTEVTSSTLLFQISLGFSFLFQIFLSLID